MAGKTYYVSGTGNDKNDGSNQKAAFRTLQKAGDLVKAGDTVYVMNGTYTNPYANILSIDNKNGSANAPITFKALSGHNPVLVTDKHNWNAISITGSSYINIEGLTLKGARDKITLAYALKEKTNLNNPATSGNGINITYSQEDSKKRSHHITISDNKVSNFPGGGITAIEADYITVKDNVVSGNAWYSPFGAQGISMLHLWNSDKNTKDYKIVIEDNTVFDNKQLVPYYAVGEITEGHGVMVDRAYIGSDSYKGKVLISDNLIYKNGGSGIQLFRADNPIDVLHNTTYKNSQVLTTGEIFINKANDVDVENSIFVGKGGQAINPISKSTGFSFEDNLVYNGSFKNTGSGSGNIIGKDPLFVNPASGNFDLQALSPAIIGGTTLGIID
ncbi:right-handed parallel beta-helix repeat-containing protein [Nostoc sp. FACHB-892]|uniref:right-handed parallel beta-helix repeat-containing protein n=1 Tax=Nostoc sp. FACHB-892 TaxID=2692843 RepID=UPI00168710B5|nr:right-handed parallel beta-helix repeat-containing protein [Nostoc sp. FACHB-892]MBD2725826.1 right-handed parallel beta-helix repeat-containing protein [Nostoc sp. FACHB-892]